MILGVYWNYAFPEKIYKYKYFKFENFIGGFDDRPASLETTIFAFNPEKVIDEIKKLHRNHPDCYIYIARRGKKIKIGTANWELYDYDFLLFKEIDKLLSKNWFVFKSKEIDFSKKDFISLKNEDEKKLYPALPKNENIRICHNEREKYSSVMKQISISCYVLSEQKINFLNELKRIAQSENINVFYYREYPNLNTSYLVIGLSNGRQGLDLKQKTYVDLYNLEEKINILIKKYNITFDYQEGFDNHNDLKIEMIVDHDFILW